MYITKVDRTYKPLFFKNNRDLNKFLEEKTILNLSEKLLTDIETETLALGLNYCPHQTPKNQPELRQNEIKTYSDKIDSIIHMAQNPMDNNTSGFISHLCPKFWTPKKQNWRKNPKIKRLFEQYRITKPLETPKGQKIKNQKILDTLKQLQLDKSINITPADKGGCTVIWPDTSYTTEAIRQLSDDSVYKEITKIELDTTITNLLVIRNYTTDKLLELNIINKREHATFKQSDAKASAIYFLPKKHKTTIPMPGRPIVAAYESTFHQFDLLITEITKPLLHRITGSLRDSIQLINILEKIKITANTKIITADVDSLYPSIPWKEGINATTQHYSDNLEYLTEHFKNKTGTNLPDPTLFKNLLTLVTENSFIHFRNQKFFHQIRGTSMGVSIAVYFANCFMMTLTWNHIYRPLPRIYLFSRYIDDFLILTEYTLNEIKELFFEPITTTNIKYTLSDLDTKANFLDLDIHLTNTGIKILPFTKPTATAFYLHASSNHPTSTIEAIPFGQLMRLKRNSSDDATFQQFAKKTIKSFTLRGYSSNLLNVCLNKVNKIPRTDLLLDNINKDTQTSIARSIKIIRPYNSTFDWAKSKNILKAIHKEIITLYSDSPIKHILEQTSSTIIFSSERSSRSFFSGNIKQVCEPKKIFLLIQIFNHITNYSKKSL